MVYYPLQTVLVTTRHKVKDRFSNKVQEKDNILTIDWHMPVSLRPPLYAISIGKTRYSLHMIRESGVFCINFIPATMNKEANIVGSISGENNNKFQKADLAIKQCATIDCCRLEKAAAHIECEVVQETEAGDHIIIIGKITKAEEHTKEKRLIHVKQGDYYSTTQ